MTAVAATWRLMVDDRRARTAASALGGWWAVLLPVVEAGAFTLLVAGVFGLREPGEYLLFAYVGLLAWRVFARGCVRAASSLLRHGPLLQRHPLPAGTVVGASVGEVLLEGALGLPVLALALAWLPGAALEPAALAAWLPAGLALHLLALLAAAPILAALNVLYRDVGLALGPALGAAVFLFPIVYDAALVPASIRGLYLANPLAAAIECYRAALLGAAPPPAGSLAAAAAVGAALAVAGWLALRRVDPRLRELV